MKNVKFKTKQNNYIDVIIKGNFENAYIIDFKNNDVKSESIAHNLILKLLNYSYIIESTLDDDDIKILQNLLINECIAQSISAYKFNIFDNKDLCNDNINLLDEKTKYIINCVNKFISDLLEYNKQ